ncbi:hypothetical protein CapIbe_021833 [Capra ibex]
MRFTSVASLWFSEHGTADLVSQGPPGKPGDDRGCHTGKLPKLTQDYSSKTPRPLPPLLDTYDTRLSKSHFSC